MRSSEIVAELAIRPIAEFSLLVSDPVFWGFGVARGDGHPVVVLPGMFAGDDYLTPLRGWLRRIGYTAVRSGLRRNPGWSQELVQELGELVERTADQSRRSVSIVGHSMGGVLARSIAVRRPRQVRRVIAIGSPLTIAGERVPAGVKIASIYSHDDVVVRPSRAPARESHASNFEVRGSHVGLANNPEVYRHLARLLAD